MSETSLCVGSWLRWHHCGSDRPQQLHPFTQHTWTLYWVTRLQRHTNTYIWGIMCWHQSNQGDAHKEVTVFLTSLFNKITECFKLLLIIYHYHLQYLNIGCFFDLFNNLKHVWEFASLHCIRIYNNKYRSGFFFYLPILLKVVISVVFIYRYDAGVFLRPPVWQKKKCFLHITHRLGSWGSC